MTGINKKFINSAYKRFMQSNLFNLIKNKKTENARVTKKSPYISFVCKIKTK